MRNLLLVVSLILALVGQGLVANHSFAMSMPQSASTATTQVAHSSDMACCQSATGCKCHMSGDHCATSAGCSAHCSATSAVADLGAVLLSSPVTQRINVPLWSVQTALAAVQTPPPNQA
ncbi:hypothetical protein HR45_17390 [Shewanella mangrovi]|uniref:CopL family metal-binding regulatory protein n=1 Tax=Shewanella mangrovi TaxID=1515746 RepID=A0A094JAM2_9GAMM|nr:hypothetical protein [Shewanella mangrovi]KFZ36277.1 hypothetical protein HR45_17390 [Shewanella mangrovi]